MASGQVQAQGGGADDDAVQARLEDWRRRLIDLSYRNRLVNYRHRAASTLEIEKPSIEAIFARMERGEPWSFFFPPDPEEETEEGQSEAAMLVDEAVIKGAHTTGRAARVDEIVVKERHPRRVNRVLENLARKSNSEFQDKALRILYVAAGFLEWVDPTRNEALSSPLVMVPVRLERGATSQPYRLFFVDDEETVVNPSLVEKLRNDAGLELPEDFVWEDKPVLTELAEIQNAVLKHGWTVRHDAVIGLFSFQKYVMYRDLLDNEAKVAAHPLVRSLACKQLEPDVPEVDVPTLEELDDAQPAAESFAILDADASQRACIEAAKRGQSYVMHGPPGTGKSQTIANVIAEAIGLGQRVLFVSEKAAALDVVHNRLRAEGLAEYSLMLHGEHASRREVVDSLYAALTGHLVPRLAMQLDSCERLNHLRQYLNNQVETLHAAEPLLADRSIRDVYATLAKLHSAPVVPGVPQASPLVSVELRQELLHLDDVFARLAERWHVSPPDYVWRGFDSERFSSDDRARVGSVVDQTRRASLLLRQAAETAAAHLGSATSLSVEGVVRLLELGDHLTQAPALAAHWLDGQWPTLAGRVVSEAPQIYSSAATAEHQFSGTYPTSSADDFRTDLGTVTQAAVDALARMAGYGASWDEHLISALPRLAVTLRDVPEDVVAVQRRLGETTELLGQPDRDADAARIDELVKLARLGFAADPRPESSWLVQAGLDRAASTLTELRPLYEAYQSHWRALEAQWEPEALDLPVGKLLADRIDLNRLRSVLRKDWTDDGIELPAADLLERFRSQYTSAFAKLKGDYRRDAKAIKATRTEGKLPDEPVAALEQMAAFQTARSEFHDAITSARVRSDLPADVVVSLKDLQKLQEEAAVLDKVAEKAANAFGSYFHGRQTDLDRVAEACVTARAAIELRHPDSDLAVLAQHLCVGAHADAGLAQAADQLEAAHNSLLGQLETLEPHVVNFAALFVGADLGATARTAAALRAPLDNLAAVAAVVQSGAITPTGSLPELLNRARSIENLHELRSGLRAKEDGWREALAQHFRAAETDWGNVQLAADWMEELHRLSGAALTPQITEQLISGERRWPDVEGLRRALSGYEETAQEVVDWFEEPRRGDLWAEARRDLSAFDQICLDLASQADSLYDWTDFRHFRRTAAEADWGDFVTALVAAEITTDDVQPAFRRAFWSRRIEALFNDEPELEDDFRGGTYQRFISDFRELDERLVRTGSDRLIARRNATRKAHVDIAGSEVAILRHEAGKRRRHKPVRRLLQEIPTLLSELKPCLMMSPLSVSHFLTVEHRFDLVIFDEASQVPPQDAVNCVYRGDQLIVAGDAKQLPPTSFFQVAETEQAEIEDDDAQEDMESVLDACQALLPNHPLSWHYRSRHEDLIAFSNREIYDGRLVTFPTPDHLSDHMGLAFTYVPDGIYERGRTQTNRREAQVVARRVVEHLHDGSGRSVGVIAFNSAQATAISEELDLLRLRDPSLEEHFSDDRLDGPFVKHLESVQGDERDVILFSVGYGRDEEGSFTMNFGPLNKVGGHRRLNVAVTRARQRVEVVASIRPADFTLSDRASQGARLLRDYIAYAEQLGDRGDRAAVDSLGDEEHHAVSELELDIAQEVENLGFRAVHQVGAGLMRIDLGVIDPSSPERFILGVESDGRGYRQTPTARDRERLRDQVLAGLGWRIHRIWSLDWVRARGAERLRLAEAIARAQASAGTSLAPQRENSPEMLVPRERMERPIFDLRDPSSLDHLPWVEAYQRKEIPFQHSVGDFHEPRNRPLQIDVARTILGVEAPVHIDYLIRRLAEAWGINRVGSRVDAAARQAISQAARVGNYKRRGDFYWPMDGAVTLVRRPVPGDPRTRREIVHIPSPERRLALRRLIEASGAASDDDLLAAAARVLGFDRLGESLRSALKRDLRAVRKGDPA